MKVEVEFEQEFEDAQASPIAVGRIYVGDSIARLMFCADGRTRLYVDPKSLDGGDVVMIPGLDG